MLTDFYWGQISSPSQRGMDIPQRPGEVKVFIGNLNFDLSLDTIASEFGSCGSIVRCKLVNGPDGRSRGMAFVSYADKAMADRAISKYQDT